jgi:hypothetical protein
MSLQQYLSPQDVAGSNSTQGKWYCSGTLWPHGEFSFGYAQSEGDGGRWHEDVMQVSDQVLEHHCDGSSALFAMDAHQEAMDCRLWFDGGKAEGPPLDLSDPANSNKPPPRGRNGITGYGQQMIKACGFLMQERWPRHRKTLGTITLPEMSPEARAGVVACWPDLTRELLQWVNRKLKKQGLPLVVCSVSEIQPKRLKRLGEGYLHWHILWLNQPGMSGNWTIEPNDLRAWLSKTLQRKVSSYQGGWINVDVKRVKGRVAAYLAKYMSKGRQAVAEAMEDWGEDNCPRTWWNMSKDARRMVNEATIRGARVGKVLEECVAIACDSDPEDAFEYLSPIVMEIAGELRQLGWVGRFKGEALGVLRSVLGYDTLTSKYIF